MTPLLTVADVAARLQISERAVARLIDKRQLPALLVARKRRIRPEALDAYLTRLDAGARVPHTDARPPRSRRMPESTLPGADYFLR